MLRLLLQVLSFAGLLLAFYFTLAYYGRVRKARWVPEILCPRQGSSCVTVVQSPYARLFGVPNSLLGIVYYLLVMGWSVLGWKPWVVWNGIALPPVWMTVRPLIAISAATVILGGYLIHALRQRLRVDCPLCYTAHAINAALLILLIDAAWGA